MITSETIKPGDLIYCDFEKHKDKNFNDTMIEAWEKKNPQRIVDIGHEDSRVIILRFEDTPGEFWSYRREHMYPFENALELFPELKKTHADLWEKYQYKREEKIKRAQERKYKPGESVREYIDRLMPLIEKEEPDRVRALKTFMQCVLPEDVERGISDALTVFLRADKFDEWGINSHFEKGLTNSVLLYGESGTGKTMIADSFASILGKNVLSISSGDLQSNVPGQTERNIKLNFDKAARENAVLVLDECDSLLSERDMVGAIMGAEINELLRCIERFNGVVILTTNRIHRLDKALERRIISKIELKAPTQQGRENIFRNLCPQKLPLASDVDFKKLSELELSGGQIKNTILLACRRAIAKNQDFVTMSDFLAGAGQELEYQHKAKNLSYWEGRP